MCSILCHFQIIFMVSFKLFIYYIIFVWKIFEKYFALLGLAPLKDIHNTQSLSSWTLGIMATEIDEFLVPPHLMHASINTMYEYMQSKLHIEDEISLQERHKQVYIASSRSLYKNDEDTLKYHLFITYYPKLHWRARPRHD